MANEILVKQGTSLVWKAAGGDYAMTMASLGIGNGREGLKGDLGATFAGRYTVTAEVNMDVAPTAGLCIEVYWAASYDNTTFPGGATGADLAYKNGEEDEWKKQLTLVGCLVLTADADAVVQTAVFVFSPPARYGMPVIINGGDQILEGDDDSHKITLTPLIDEVQ